LSDPEAGMAAPPARYSEEVFSAYQIVPAGISGDDVDSEGVVAQRYGAAPVAYLIRPDGYVGFRGDRDSVRTRLPDYLAKLFSSAGAAR